MGLLLRCRSVGGGVSAAIYLFQEEIQEEKDVKGILCG